MLELLLWWSEQKFLRKKHNSIEEFNLFRRYILSIILESFWNVNIHDSARFSNQRNRIHECYIKCVPDFLKLWGFFEIFFNWMSHLGNWLLLYCFFFKFNSYFTPGNLLRTLKKIQFILYVISDHMTLSFIAYLNKNLKFKILT